jgi:hypothetical protein
MRVGIKTYFCSLYLQHLPLVGSVWVNQWMRKQSHNLQSEATAVQSDCKLGWWDNSGGRVDISYCHAHTKHLGIWLTYRLWFQEAWEGPEPKVCISVSQVMIQSLPCKKRGTDNWKCRDKCQGRESAARARGDSAGEGMRQKNGGLRTRPWGPQTQTVGGGWKLWRRQSQEDHSVLGTLIFLGSSREISILCA